MTLFLATVLALCPPVGERVTCVVDGDTFWTAGEKVRLADIDAPETEQAKCSSERAKGYAARDRLLELLRDGFAVERVGRDRYGRSLAVVRDGQSRSVGEVLVSEGLAREWRGKRLPWCDGLPPSAPFRTGSAG